MQGLRETLEGRQITIYFSAVVLAAGLATLVSGTTALADWINPALALMLFVTFLQVPLAALAKAFSQVRFLAALFAANFVVVPIVVAGLVQFLPANPMVRLGVLIVLLTPCIDYVVTFSQLGRADARLLLAATPALLVAQMLLLPVYLRVFLGDSSSGLIQAGPFVHAFIWLIAVPLILAVAVQLWAARHRTGERVTSVLGVLPVPSTALVLFVVIAAVVPRLAPAVGTALIVAPIYVAFAIAMPLLGWGVARVFRLDAAAARAVAFSASTRNSLVVLALAFAVPGAIPVLPAIIVTQTLVELLSELAYIRLLPKLGARATLSASQLSQ
ncbi:arsenic resistance protein [Paraburkholderia rhizosphaerae]|uniref:arsenic resistance protein n=1 Tax=Paraburkholderia rhizosphaerae TaxID=480658 RepID=UPI0010651EEC|nr:bile acid:sodium symporter [Paraburkholderia rhizosphaerae]